MKNIKELFFNLTGKKARSVTELTDGFNNENYLINDAYVLRLKGQDGDETINHHAELEAYKAVEPLNINEKNIYFDEETGTKISKFVHSSRPYVDTPTNEQILYVCKAIKKLHKQELKTNYFYDPISRLNTYKKLVDKEDYIDEKYESKIINEVNKIYENEELVLCHNDLVKGNLLFRFNGLTIIDWEYSSMNSIYFDLASFISENELNEEQSNFFLTKYFGYKYSSRKLKKVQTFMKLQDILFYYWALYLYKKRGTPIYKEIASIKEKRVQNALQLIKD